MVTRQDQQALGELWIGCQSLEEFGPFRRTARVGEIPGDQDGVERVLSPDDLQLCQRLSKSFVAARTRSAALDAKAILLADHMNVGQMSDTPKPTGDRWCAIFLEVARLAKGGIGNGPDQR